MNLPEAAKLLRPWYAGALTCSNSDKKRHVKRPTIVICDDVVSTFTCDSLQKDYLIRHNKVFI